MPHLETFVTLCTANERCVYIMCLKLMTSLDLEVTIKMLNLAHVTRLQPALTIKLRLFNTF